MHIDIIRNNLTRSIWETENMMQCIEDSGCWDEEFCGSPVWKHVYHTLHSLDQWFTNPNIYEEPSFHKEGQNSLDVKSEESVSGETLFSFLHGIKGRINAYLGGLDDDSLAECENGDSRTRFERISMQFKHWHTHLGILMAYLHTRCGKWVFVSGGSRPIPEGFGVFFD